MLRERPVFDIDAELAENRKLTEEARNRIEFNRRNSQEAIPNACIRQACSTGNAEVNGYCQRCWDKGWR